MNNLAEREWIYLSQTLYRLYQCQTYETFCSCFFEQIKRIIPYSKSNIFQIQQRDGAFYRVNPRSAPTQESLKRTGEYVKSNCQGSSNEYIFAPWSTVFRQSDISHQDEWLRSPVYLDYWEPEDIYHGMTAVLIHDDRPAGTITLFRPRTEQNFNNREFYIMDTLKNHLAIQLYQFLEPTPPAEGAVSVDDSKSRFYLHASQYGLTKREAEITGHLCTNMSRADICQQLFISNATLRKHIYNIYGKTNVNSHAQLVMWSREHLNI